VRFRLSASRSDGAGPLIDRAVTRPTLVGERQSDVKGQHLVGIPDERQLFEAGDGGDLIARNVAKLCRH
jgi:hypothetical protein